MGDGGLRTVLALSAAGATCLPLFALLLRLQPQFVHGLRVDAARAARNCLLGGACYAGVLLLSLALRCARARRPPGADALGSRTAYDRRYNLPFAEHANDSFATAMKALDARTPGVQKKHEAQRSAPALAARQGPSKLQYA